MNIEIKELQKVIKGVTILEDISLKLSSGKIYGIRGKNGSGKTMLLKAICGLIRPTSGQVLIDGKALGGKMDFPESVGVLLEKPGFIAGFSAFDNLKALADIRKQIGNQEIQDILQEAGLEADSRKKFRSFSLGMKQKLGIAAALMEEPELILLDEPTNALDSESVLQLRTSLIKRKEQGALIVITSHDKEELSFLSDEIITIENGHIGKDVVYKEALA